MRRYAMTDQDAYRRLVPRRREDWLSLARIASVVLMAVLAVAGLYYLKQSTQEARAQNWMSAVADIEDVRMQPAVLVNSQRGGVMLYDVQILAKYTAIGIQHEHWITVEQTPRNLDDAHLQAFRWKGKTCIVRWKPSDPSYVVAEVG